jgi:mannose-6-phosphate isomerase-like protein (cupin superfamily)
MMDFIFFMHDDVPRGHRRRDGKWMAYFAKLREVGAFQGGSSIGDGVCASKSSPTAAITGHISGYIRVCAENLESASIKRRRNYVSYESINFRQKFGLFKEQWQPKVIAEMNDYQFKVVKLQGDFVWHHHSDTDETFIVVEGDLRIDLRDGAVHVSTGEMFVIPKGVEHKPYAEKEVKLLLIEPRGVLNTGHEGGERTAVNDVWI